MAVLLHKNENSDKWNLDLDCWREPKPPILLIFSKKFLHILHQFLQSIYFSETTERWEEENLYESKERELNETWMQQKRLDEMRCDENELLG